MRKLVQQLTGVVFEIPAEQCVTFYCGGYGDFDFCAEKASMEIKKPFPAEKSKDFILHLILMILTVKGSMIWRKGLTEQYILRLKPFH